MIDIIIEKEKIQEQLKEGVCKVTFTKANGDKRVMNCTLKEGIVPPAAKEDPLTQKKVRAVSEEVQVVYDTDKNGWRSFRWNSVEDFEFKGV